MVACQPGNQNCRKFDDAGGRHLEVDAVIVDDTFLFFCSRV